MDKLGRYKKRLGNAMWAAKSRVQDQHPNVLLITHPIRISESQIFPFYFFRDELVRELHFDFREITLPEYESGKAAPVANAEFVFVQPWWDVAPQRLQALLERIRRENPHAKLIFLDSYAPVDLRLAQYVAPYVDVYVKKHVFRDRTRYGKPTRGDTNLVDYYGKLYGVDYPNVIFPVPDSLLDKLVVGPTFATGQHLLSGFLKEPQFRHDERTIDLHARLGGGGDDWYGMMRDHARRVIREIDGVTTAASGAVDHKQYMRELCASKICFSPFGFGEVCWRDYEAVQCGAMLLKPDMSDVETDPDIFRPFETYVPVSWNFSDVEEKVRRYLADEAGRRTIVENAYRTLSEYFKGNGFIRHISKLIGSRPGYGSIDAPIGVSF